MSSYLFTVCYFLFLCVSLLHDCSWIVWIYDNHLGALTYIQSVMVCTHACLWTQNSAHQFLLKLFLICQLVRSDCHKVWIGNDFSSWPFGLVSEFAWTDQNLHEIDQKENILSIVYTYELHLTLSLQRATIQLSTIEHCSKALTHILL